MPSEHPNPVSRNPRIANPDTHVDLRANDHTKPDTRRFAGIFPLELPEAASTERSYATDEEELDQNSDYPSCWEFVATPDSSAAPAESIASTDDSSALSAAQRVVAGYRAVHGNDHASGPTTSEINEKDLPQIPDDQRSMYTLATPTDAQPSMDMMWRPKPKVHMHRTDQRALVHAQTQAIAMMHDAGLKPTNKIQCRRRGCADILPGVEALKYHLHIHNIADATFGHNTAPPSVREPSLVGCPTLISRASKRSHSRSKSTHGTRHKHSTPPRKLSAGSLLPSIFSPRESAPGVHHVPTIATVANALVPERSKSPVPLSMRSNQAAPSRHHSTPSRGQRTRKESMGISVGTAYSPSIAMLLSPPSTPTKYDHFAPTPHTNSSTLFVLNPATRSENDDTVSTSNKNMPSVHEKFAGSRSPQRALSPARAKSPIRNGIRRVLSFGRSDDFVDQ